MSTWHAEHHTPIDGRTPLLAEANDNRTASRLNRIPLNPASRQLCIAPATH